jgi:hypothetical protein
MTKNIIWHEVKSIPYKGIDNKSFSVKPEDKLLLNIGSKPTYSSQTRGRRVSHVKSEVFKEILAIYKWREAKCKKQLLKKSKK